MLTVATQYSGSLNGSQIRTKSAHSFARDFRTTDHFEVPRRLVREGAAALPARRESARVGGYRPSLIVHLNGEKWCCFHKGTCRYRERICHLASDRPLVCRCRFRYQSCCGTPCSSTWLANGRLNGMATVVLFSPPAVRGDKQHPVVSFRSSVQIDRRRNVVFGFSSVGAVLIHAVTSAFKDNRKPI